MSDSKAPSTDASGLSKSFEDRLTFTDKSDEPQEKFNWADDVDTAGDKVRDLCDAAVTRVDDAVAKVNDKLDPAARVEQDARVEAS